MLGHLRRVCNSRVVITDTGTDTNTDTDTDTNTGNTVITRDL
jgi:hypothetical protein